MNQKIILPLFIHSLAAMLKRIAKNRYYIGISLMMIFFIPLSYACFSFAVYHDLFDHYNELAEPLKNYLSLEAWWIETIIRLTVPVFLSVALSIQLATLHDKDAEAIKSIAPWIPKIRGFLSVKMPLFFVFTASVLFGAIFLLVFGGESQDYPKLIMAIFPIAMLILSEFMRSALSSNPSRGALGKLTMKYHKGLTKISLLIAGLAWVYSDLLTPLKNRWDIFMYAKNLV